MTRVLAVVIRTRKDIVIFWRSEALLYANFPREIVPILLVRLYKNRTVNDYWLGMTRAKIGYP